MNSTYNDKKTVALSDISKKGAVKKKCRNADEWAKNYVEIAVKLRGKLTKICDDLCAESSGELPPEIFGKAESTLGALGKIASQTSKLADTEKYWRDYVEDKESAKKSDASETFTPDELDALLRFLRKKRPEAFES